MDSGGLPAGPGASEVPTQPGLRETGSIVVIRVREALASLERGDAQRARVLLVEALQALTD